MDIIKITAEVDELVKHANSAFKGGSVAAASVLLETALMKLPNHTGAVKLRSKMKAAADGERADVVPPMPGDLGTTDKFGLGTFMSTGSNKPQQVNPDALAPWEGGANPLSRKQTSWETVPAPHPPQPTHLTPTTNATHVPYQPPPTQQRIPGVDGQPTFANTHPESTGSGVGRPRWIAPLDEDETSAATPTPRRRTSAYRSKVNEQPGYHGHGVFANLRRPVSTVLPVSYFRFSLWVAMALFTAIAVIYSRVAFSPTVPDATRRIAPAVVTQFEAMMTAAKIDDAEEFIKTELAAQKDKKIQRALNVLLARAYVQQGEQLLRSKDFASAIERYQLAVECDDANGANFTYLANAHWFAAKQNADKTKVAGQLNEAMSCVAASLERDPNSTETLNLGMKIANEQKNVKLTDEYRKMFDKLTATKQ